MENVLCYSVRFCLAQLGQLFGRGHTDKGLGFDSWKS